MPSFSIATFHDVTFMLASTSSSNGLSSFFLVYRFYARPAGSFAFCSASRVSHVEPRDAMRATKYSLTYAPPRRPPSLRWSPAVYSTARWVFRRPRKGGLPSRASNRGLRGRKGVVHCALALLSAIVPDLLQFAHLPLFTCLSDHPDAVDARLLALSVSRLDKQHQAVDVLELDKP